MVTLMPMSDDDFRAYLDRAIAEYAEEKVRAGVWHPAEAMDKSRREFEYLLPNGLNSEKQHVLTILDAESGAKVGVVWFAVFDQGRRPMAFVFDFRIEERYRRQGYATQALFALEGRVRALGLDTIGLHVFAHNTAARRLYEKAGYIETDINMAKSLAAADAHPAPDHA